MTEANTDLKTAAQAATYVVTYRYSKPSPAGPFTGRVTTTERYRKGDDIHAVFGSAVVTSCREKKEPQ